VIQAQAQGRPENTAPRRESGHCQKVVASPHASSTGRCNTSAKAFSGRFKL
jgi:hypothetical protein